MVAGLDERVLQRERALPQPGGRDTAPGELVLLQSFLNTHFDLVDDWGADLLATPEQLSRWFGARGLLSSRHRVSGADLGRALALREGLRELTRANRDRGFRPDPAAVAELSRAAHRAPVTFLPTHHGLVLAPHGTDPINRAFATILAISGQAMIDGRWHRLKTCPGDHCGWVFYDHSRNNSSRWCSMAVCGGRTKARAHYRRHRLTSGE